MDLYGGVSMAVETNRVSHAYIIKGIGEEAMSLALHIAAAVNCLAGFGQPCGACNSCRKTKGANHPDVSIIRAEGESIGIDAIRKLQRGIYVKPYQGRKKVYIIPEGEKMTVQAQNCLLKVLEDPPGDAVIIIVSLNYSNLLPTVLSRCQILNMDAAGHIEDSRLYRELTVCIIEGNFMEASAKIDLLIREEGKGLGDFLGFLLAFFRDVLVYKVSAREELLNIKEGRGLIERTARKLDYSRVDGFIGAVSRAGDALRFNANPQLTMEALLLEIQEV